MSENYHAMKFSIFKRYCKHVNSDGPNRYWQVECANKQNTQPLGPHRTKACHKHFCPVFKRAAVIRRNVVGGIAVNDRYYKQKQGV